MLKNYQHEKELQRERIEGKSCESLFSNIIVQGTNCSHFESEIIVEKAKEVFRIGEWSEGRTLQPGQMVYIAVSCTEPAGKPLEECAKERIVLTHLDMEADVEVLGRYGAKAKRRALACVTADLCGTCHPFKSLKSALNPSTITCSISRYPR